MYVVEWAVPFTRTMSPELKLEPLIETIIPVEPAVALDGLTELIVGFLVWPPSEIRAQPVAEITSSAIAKVMLIFDIILSTSW
jgi:hypothetical protein